MSNLTSSRDMDLVREILLELEKQPPKNHSGFRGPQGCHIQQVTHHLEIMADAGLVKLLGQTNVGFVVRLTWEGYEFLEAIRDDKRWEKVKAEMSKGGGFVYQVAKSIAIDFLEEEINPNRVKSLRLQLLQRYNNLNMLEEQAAEYGAKTVPLELQNKINAEKEAIAELKEKLNLLVD